MSSNAELKQQMENLERSLAQAEGTLIAISTTPRRAKILADDYLQDHLARPVNPDNVCRECNAPFVWCRCVEMLKTELAEAQQSLEQYANDKKQK
jgi:hypothetical protein